MRVRIGNLRQYALALGQIPRLRRIVDHAELHRGRLQVDQKHLADDAIAGFAPSQADRGKYGRHRQPPAPSRLCPQRHASINNVRTGWRSGQ